MGQSPLKIILNTHLTEDSNLSLWKHSGEMKHLGIGNTKNTNYSVSVCVCVCERERERERERE